MTIKVTCSVEGEAIIEYQIPAGQLLPADQAPFELDTSGYYYSEIEDTGIVVPGSFNDFAGAILEVDGLATITHPTLSGVEYEAYLLVAYEDGRIIEEELEYECSSVAETTPADITVLPFTGVDSFGLGLVAALAIAAGIAVLRRKE